MTMTLNLLKIAKLLLADVDYFKLPHNLLDNIYEKFKNFNNKHINDQIKPHFIIVLDLKEFVDEQYKYINKFNKSDDYTIQIMFLDIYNQQKQFIGDKIFDKHQMLDNINKIKQDTRIKGVPNKLGNTIIIQQRQNNIKNCLQHELIHAVKNKFKMNTNMKNTPKTYNKFIKQYLLSNNQLASFVTDCCNYYNNNYNKLIKDLQLINQIYKQSFNEIFDLLFQLHKDETILFLIMYKKYKPKKFNKIINFIINKVKQ